MTQSDTRRRVVVVHKHRRKRGWKFSIIRLLAIWFVVAWIVAEYAGPDNLPFLPGSCEVAPEPTGISGVAYTGGQMVNGLANGGPSVDQVRATLDEIANDAGAATGAFLAAVEGSVPVVPEDDEMVPAVTPVSCVPCPAPGGGGGPVEVAAQAALAAGWTGEDAVVAVAIAGAESGWNPQAENPSSSAKGLWQTMMTYHEPKYQGASWSDPYANARVAYQVFQDQGWSAWTVHTSGAYRAHLDVARAAVAAAQGSTVRTVAATTSPTSVPMAGLQPPAQRAADYVRATWGVQDIGGHATSGHIVGSKHYVGLAIDVMTYADTATGQAIADYFAGPGYEAFGVENVIHNRRIYNEPQGWHAYTGSSPHTEHVHVDFREDGGTGATPVSSTCTSPAGHVAADGFRVGTFNVLGATHTAPGGNRPHLPDWDERFPGVAQLLADHGLAVVGFQEMQAPQQKALLRLGGWATHGNKDNVIGWRTDTWTLEDTRSVTIPYFHGNPRVMPITKLRHTSGHAVWFVNVHNPASVRGPAQHWRDEAVRREVAAIRDLDGPMVWLGDMNERDRFGRQIARAGLHPAGTEGIDWIVGTPSVGFTGYQRIESPLVRQTTDHPLVFADLLLGKTL